MSIQKVIIKNFKLIKDLDQDFQGKSLFIIGDNGIGKSTFLQAIQIALGSKNIPPLPITHGEDSAYVEVITGENGEQYKFTAKFKPGAKPIIEVTTPDGARDKNKTVIGNIVGQIDFDLIGFVDGAKTAEGRKKQVALFQSFCDPDIIEELRKIALKIANHEEERTEIGQHVKSNQGFIDEAGITPGDFVKYADKMDHDILQTDYNDAIALNKKIDDQAELSTARKQRELEIERQIDRLQKEATGIVDTEKRYVEWAKENTTVDTEPLNDKMKEAIDHNEMHAKVAVFKGKEEKVKSLKEEYGEKTALIESEREAYDNAVKDMGTPVEGLTFDQDQLYYNGNPLDSNTLSTSEMMHLGIQIRIAKDPGIKVLFIERGESIGEQRLKDIQLMAKKNGYQILMEEVQRGTKEMTFKFMTED